MKLFVILNAILALAGCSGWYARPEKTARDDRYSTPKHWEGKQDQGCPMGMSRDHNGFCRGLAR